jgi:hypothetical protein
MMYIANFFLLAVGVYLLVYSTYSFFLIAVSLFERRKTSKKINSSSPEILLVMPSYQPSGIFSEVLGSVEAAAKNHNIKGYVLLQEADKFYEELARGKGFYVEEKTFRHLPGNSYQHALRHIATTISKGQEAGQWNPKFVMILDKDNVLDENFFNRIPDLLYTDFEIIQGRRMPLNCNTSFAFFDAVSEALNDAMFRKAKQQCGMMVEISGSGVLIETSLFIETVQKLDGDAPGFDKNFMVKILTSPRKVKSIFWPASQLREEKMTDPSDMQRQRLRWFGEQYYNAIFNFKALVAAGLTKKELAPVDYLITLWRPPRSVQLMATGVLALIELIGTVMYPFWPFEFPLYTIAFLTFGCALALFLIDQGIFLQTLLHSAKLPRLTFNNLVSAFRSMKKENRGTFIHTRHRF